MKSNHTHTMQTLSRNVQFLPLDTTFLGFICQFMSIGIMIVTKLVLISNLLIYAPYTYPLGMVMEFFLILPFAFFFKSKFYFQWLYICMKTLFEFVFSLVDNLSVVYTLCSSIMVFPNDDKIGKSPESFKLCKIYIFLIVYFTFISR